MTGVLQAAVAVVGSALLVWGAVSDAKWRKIPVVAGFGMLGLGLIVLVAEGLYIWAAYYLVAIWSTRGGIWRYVLAGASLVMVVVAGWEAVPLVVGVLLVATLFWMKWFGGGDSQLAVGLMGIGHDWLVVGVLFGVTILAAIVLSVRRGGGVVPAARRLVWVARNLNRPPDEDAIRTPWGIIAAVAGVGYLWLWALVL
jgi:hypothetical protein